MGKMEIGGLEIEVVFALPDQQFIVKLRLPEGSRVLQAVQLSGLLERCSQQLETDPAVGIFGKPVPADQLLKDGDRVELYRPLLVDPKTRRRNRALKPARS